VDINLLKELLVKNIADLLQIRRPAYFVHVNRMSNDRFPKLLLHVTHMDIGQEEETAGQYS